MPSARRASALGGIVCYLFNLFRGSDPNMRRLLSAFGVAVIVAGATAILVAQGQGPDHAAILIPDSSVELLSGIRMAAWSGPWPCATRMAVAPATITATPKALRSRLIFGLLPRKRVRRKGTM